MKTRSIAIPVAALALALGSFSDATAHNAERRNRRNQNQGQERSQGETSARSRSDQSDRGRTSAARGGRRAERADRDDRASQSPNPERERAAAPSRPRDNRDNEVRRDARSSARGGRERNAEVGQRDSRDDYRAARDPRNRGRETYRDNDRGRYQNRRGHDDYRGAKSGGYSRGYYAPRLLTYRSAPRRYYGSGNRLTLHFGIGSGYRYGSAYSGRVYGYRRSVPTYGSYVAYGDLRLKVSPRHAAVYVDGYYAGVVDDFDGFFQRLTLEVGPHEIEIEAPGYDSQAFDVYVDPQRTIDLHADLRR